MSRGHVLVLGGCAELRVVCSYAVRRLLGAILRCAVQLARRQMEKPNYALVSRFRLRCVLISVALIFWWTLVMVHFSVERRAPMNHSSLGRPRLSMQREEALHSELPADTNYESYTRMEEVTSVTEEKAPETWPKVSSQATQDGVEGSGGEEEEKVVDAQGEGSPVIAEPHIVEQPEKACEGRYVFVHELDPYFNEDLLKQCHRLSLWQDLCPMVGNSGLGPPLNNTDGVFSEADWYMTSQFALEEIFHNRMKQYKCLTTDSSKAAAVFVPFYAGFEIAMNLWGANLTVRDAAPNRLYRWLTRQAEWERFHGHDHFLVGGRITWDFRRRTDEEKDWGNKLFVLPPGLNMTLLAIEASPWHDNDVAIPYPTYFHPSSKDAIQRWQDRMRTMERESLFSFVGAPRPGLSTSIRGKIMNQCTESRHCKLLNCNDDDNRVCFYPHKVMKVFEHSTFCLQPQGDSYTRRSTFDSMLAGCIPVFFHYNSAYSQYVWHLPANHSSYSVLIDEKGIKNDTVSIEDVLLGYSPEQIKSMREEVIRTIPGLVYADPRSGSLVDTKDAFDISVQGVIDKIADWKKQTRDGTAGGIGAGSPDSYIQTGEVAEKAHAAWRENMGDVKA